jgi:hypothetical protein
LALGAGTDNSANALAVGGGGGIYVAGQFSGTNNFGANDRDERPHPAGHLGWRNGPGPRYCAGNRPHPARLQSNEEHALLVGDTLCALRDDLNALVRASEP